MSLDANVLLLNRNGKVDHLGSLVADAKVANGQVNRLCQLMQGHVKQEIKKERETLGADLVHYQFDAPVPRAIDQRSPVAIIDRFEPETRTQGQDTLTLTCHTLT